MPVRFYEKPPKTQYDVNLEKFERYHALNEWVYREFEQICFDLIGRGFTRYQPNAIINAIRVRKDREAAPTLAGHSTFHFSNTHSPFYARLFQKTNPELRYFFKTRFQTSKLKVVSI